MLDPTKRPVTRNSSEMWARLSVDGEVRIEGGEIMRLRDMSVEPPVAEELSRARQAAADFLSAGEERRDSAHVVCAVCGVDFRLLPSEVESIAECGMNTLCRHAASGRSLTGKVAVLRFPTVAEVLSFTWLTGIDAHVLRKAYLDGAE